MVAVVVVIIYDKKLISDGFLRIPIWVSRDRDNGIDRMARKTKRFNKVLAIQPALFINDMRNKWQTSKKTKKAGKNLFRWNGWENIDL